MKPNYLKKLAIPFLIALMPFASVAQTAKEFVDKTGKEKIKKSTVVEQAPVTAAGFGDGHGRSPVLTSRSQIPVNVALISFYMLDVGTETKGGYTISEYWLGTQGGNFVATAIENQTIETLKASFKEQGINLLTPEEFIDNPAKKDYYYNKFTPQVSKLAKFLSNVENKRNHGSVVADYYRPFDISVAWDPVRSESLIADLAKNLGVDGVVTVAVTIRSDKNNVYFHTARLALNGPNPIPKEDKKYVAQNMGNGYYAGQIFSLVTYDIPKGVHVGTIKRGKVTDRSTSVLSKTTYVSQEAEVKINPEGLEVVMAALVEKSFESMDDAISKAANKYSKK